MEQCELKIMLSWSQARSFVAAPAMIVATSTEIKRRYPHAHLKETNVWHMIIYLNFFPCTITHPSLWFLCTGLHGWFPRARELVSLGFIEEGVLHKVLLGHLVAFESGNPFVHHFRHFILPVHLQGVHVDQKYTCWEGELDTSFGQITYFLANCILQKRSLSIVFARSSR